MEQHFSLILLPTLQCNAACDYCFENKGDEELSLDHLSILIRKVLDYMEEKVVQRLSIYWQGGEVMMLPLQWYEQAFHIIEQAAESREIAIQHSIQSNMIDYSETWNPLIAEMFGSNVGSSMDFPNLYRKVKNQSAEEYSELWARNVRKAQDAGIEMQIIAIPNTGTFEMGAERFYEHFVDELQIPSFQLNTPFPGGEANAVKQELPLNTEQLSQFYRDLAKIWLERGYHQGVRIGPFDEWMKYFLGQDTCIPCIWRENCSDEFICIDAKGNVAQCDCWVTSYPDYWFGNIFEEHSLSELLHRSKVRQDFQIRPEILMQRETCIECEYLALCHGGCPIRTYSICGNLFEKDPYCELYKSLFSCMEESAVELVRRRGFP